MKKVRSILSGRLHWVFFVLILLPTFALYVLYAVNMVEWRNAPRFGYRTITDSGPNLIAEVFGPGLAAGFRVGDRIISINGKSFSTYGELYTKIRTLGPGQSYTYRLKRDGREIEITSIPEPTGINAVLRQSLPFFLLGLVFTLTGIIVFLMKPNAHESMLFFAMTSCAGTVISYGMPSGLYSPSWLELIIEIITIVLPAYATHFAFSFPKRRSFLTRIPWLWVLPYLIGLILVFVRLVTLKSVWDVPVLLRKFIDVFLLISIALLLFSQVWNILKDSSYVIRLQSQVMVIGAFLGTFIPVADLFARSVWRVYLFRDPNTIRLLFLFMFPLSIAYTIIKHDLFAIDVIVRRTYGYILSTAAVVGVYGLVVLILDVTFQSSEVARSPLFSIIFALAVVFFFRPMHERVQRLVDRVFYRQRYDYRKTIKEISEAMIKILDPGQIYKTLIGSVVREMFLENGLLLLPSPQGGSFDIKVAEHGKNSETHSGRIPKDHALTRLLKEKSDVIMKYEADLDPAYEPHREPLKEAFNSLESELMLPLNYQGEMRGIISLGGKKSGKMFTAEDLDLLKTITNQTAVALENAKLFEENIEKTRMEEELAIARDLQMSMLPAACPKIEGFELAAHCTPAREVGGDFYDFIEMEGGRLGLVLGDVTGKSVSGALVTAASRSILRILSEEGGLAVGEIMVRANRRTKKDIKSGMFVALLLGVIESAGRTLTLSNAGQTQPVIFKAKTGEASLLETEGDTFPLGIIDESDYRETRLRLEPGDKVVFYTDGIVEAMNGEQEIFGFDRLIGIVKESGFMGADQLMGEILSKVNDFVAGALQHDDITLITLSVNSEQ